MSNGTIARLPSEVRITIDAATAPAMIVRDLAKIVKEHPGKTPLRLDIAAEGGWKGYRISAGVDASSAFFTACRKLLGEVSVNHISTPVLEEIALPPKRTRKNDYREYLKSDHWQQMRRVAREHYGDTCCLCGSTSRLEVHHRTYDNIGKERLKDLIVLCGNCHGAVHGKPRKHYKHQ